MAHELMPRCLPGSQQAHYQGCSRCLAQARLSAVITTRCLQCTLLSMTGVTTVIIIHTLHVLLCLLLSAVLLLLLSSSSSALRFTILPGSMCADCVHRRAPWPHQPLTAADQYARGAELVQECCHKCM